MPIERLSITCMNEEVVASGVGSPALIISGSYPQMVEDINTKRALLGNDRVEGILYADGLELDAGFIGRWKHDPGTGTIRPIGKVLLRNVPDTIESTIVFDTNGNGLGAEEYTTANAASDPNGNEANATTGWGTVLAAIASDVDSSVGAFALRVDGAGASARGFFESPTGFPVVNGEGYRISIDAKQDGVGTEQQFVSWLGFSDFVTTPITTASYVTYLFQLTASASLAFIQVASQGLGPNASVFFDNVSIRQRSKVNTCTVASVAGFAVGQIISCFSRANGETLFSGCRISNVGVNTITFEGAAVAVKEGYQILTESEFGKWANEANGGLFSSERSRFGVDFKWQNGMRVNGTQEGDGVFMSFLGSSGTIDSPSSWGMRCRVTINESGAGVDSACGVGLAFDLGAVGPCIVNASVGGGRYRRGGFTNVYPTPLLSSTTNLRSPQGDPLGSQSLVNLIGSAHHNRDATIAFSLQVIDGTDLEAGGGFNTNSAAEGTLGWTSGVGNEGAWLLCQVLNGGAMNGTLEEIEIVWES